MFHNRRRQKGSLYLVAIFVLVVMGFLTLMLSRIQWSNSDAQTKEVLGTQSWLLAQSVNEEALTILYPLQSERSAIAANCSTLKISALVNSDNQFVEANNCRLIELSCTPSGTLDQINYFKLMARVSCGTGKSLVERVEEVWIKE